MRGKKLLAAFLLGVGLCFVPTLGHGEINKWVQEQIFERKVRNINFELLRARVNYMMRNPTTFLEVNFTYPNLLVTFPELPENVHVFAKIVVTIRDTRVCYLFSHSFLCHKQPPSFSATLISYSMNSVRPFWMQSLG